MYGYFLSLRKERSEITLKKKKKILVILIHYQVQFFENTVKTFVLF